MLKNNINPMAIICRINHPTVPILNFPILFQYQRPDYKYCRYAN